MKLSEIKKGIADLPFSEKLLLVEDIWDSIAKSKDKAIMNEWQKQELERRYKEFQENHSETTEWNQVHKELRSKT